MKQFRREQSNQSFTSIPCGCYFKTQFLLAPGPEKMRVLEKTHVLGGQTCRSCFIVSLCGLWKSGRCCAQPHFALVYSFLAPPPVLHCCCLVLHLPFPRQPLILASGSAFWRTLAKLFGKYITVGLRGGLHTFHSTEGVF